MKGGRATFPKTLEGLFFHYETTRFLWFNLIVFVVHVRIKVFTDYFFKVQREIDLGDSLPSLYKTNSTRPASLAADRRTTTFCFIEISINIDRL